MFSCSFGEVSLMFSSVAYLRTSSICWLRSLNSFSSVRLLLRVYILSFSAGVGSCIRGDYLNWGGCWLFEKTDHCFINDGASVYGFSACSGIISCLGISTTAEGFGGISTCTAIDSLILGIVAAACIFKLVGTVYITLSRLFRLTT